MTLEIERAEGAPIFEPLCSKEEMLEGLSREACQVWDMKRRIVGVCGTKTPEELLEMARKSPEEVSQMALLADELREHAEFELEIMNAVFARLSWALDHEGHIQLARDSEGPSHH